MTEIKPCPFCGGVATVQTIAVRQKGGRTNGMCTVGCTECSALLGEGFNFEEAAIMAWNRQRVRPPIDALCNMLSLVLSARSNAKDRYLTWNEITTRERKLLEYVRDNRPESMCAWLSQQIVELGLMTFAEYD